MLARDINSNPTQYRTWVVPNEPDFTGQFYTGLKSGPNAFADVTAYAIQNPTDVVDFNLPLPSMWSPHPSELIVDFPIRKVLPYPVEDSCLAIIDGYAYMFGGKITDHILRADINNPADWFDTGATLPTPLFGAQLAIVGDFVYLFGGNNGVQSNLGLGAIDTIFRAPVSNLLQWTDTGAKLPRRLQYSNLGMYNGTLYLFGGQEINCATNLVLTASTSDPLTWSIASYTIPVPTYGSTFAQVDGYWTLFGGMTTPNTPTNVMWRAPVWEPSLWLFDGYLPYQHAFGQFFPMGTDGYLIGPMVGAALTGFTPILQCKLNSANQFIDTKQVVRGSISHSQQAIIYDRFWLFGGSGEVAVFACNQQLKYNICCNTTAQTYGQVTRVLLPMVDNLNNPFQAIGIPYWRTDYQF